MGQDDAICLDCGVVGYCYTTRLRRAKDEVLKDITGVYGKRAYTIMMVHGMNSTALWAKTRRMAWPVIILKLPFYCSIGYIGWMDIIASALTIQLQSSVIYCRSEKSLIQISPSSPMPSPV